MAGPPVKVGAYGGQEINGIWAEVQLTVGPVFPQTHPVVVFPGGKIKLAKCAQCFPHLWSEGYDS